jgi:hypothetical protein
LATTATSSQYSKVVLHDTIKDMDLSDLTEGLIVLVPSVGKRAVRQAETGNGHPSLVYPKSGKVDVGAWTNLAKLQHPARVVGHVTDGWVAGQAAPSVAPQPKAPKAAAKGKLAKGSPEAKERMAKARAARGTKAPQSTPAASETATVLATLADVADGLAATLRKLSASL